MINRILIVGLGSIGKRHLDISRELLPQAEIAILRHKVDSTIPEGADHIFSTMAEALDFAPQLAVIANPSTFHISAAMPLAKAGTHLLIEKPVSATTKDVEKLLKICKKTDSVLAIGYNLRFLQSLQTFKSMLDDQVIGNVWSVRSEIGQYLPSWRPGSDYRKGVSAQRVLGGGSLLELSHEIDYLRWIFGEVEWVQGTLTQQSDLEIDVEDTAHLILGFTDKASNKPLIASVNLDFIRQDMVRMCTAIGKLGSLRWNGITGTVELWKIDSQDWQEIYKNQVTRDESYIEQWKNFITSIKKLSKPLISGEDGLRVLQIIEAARLANKSKSQVKIGDPSNLREL
jgi:predicted dehydrogenase